MGASRRSGRTILLIEDDPAIGEFIAELVREEGYEATIVVSVAGGIALLATTRFDLVLSDAFTEGEFAADRWRMLERIRHAADTVPVIICTAHRADTFAGYAARGFAALLEKPFDLDDLLGLLARLLGEQSESSSDPFPAGRDGSRPGNQARQAEK